MSGAVRSHLCSLPSCQWIEVDYRVGVFTSGSRWALPQGQKTKENTNKSHIVTQTLLSYYSSSCISSTHWHPPLKRMAESARIESYGLLLTLGARRNINWKHTVSVNNTLSIIHMRRKIKTGWWNAWRGMADSEVTYGLMWLFIYSHCQ